jgi:hypothetical protein
VVALVVGSRQLEVRRHLVTVDLWVVLLIIPQEKVGQNVRDVMKE